MGTEKGKNSWGRGGLVVGIWQGRACHLPPSKESIPHPEVCELGSSRVTCSWSRSPSSSRTASSLGFCSAPNSLGQQPASLSYPSGFYRPISDRTFPPNPQHSLFLVAATRDAFPHLPRPHGWALNVQLVSPVANYGMIENSPLRSLIPFNTLFEG